MLCLHGVPDLTVAPQDEAGLSKTLQTWPRGWFHPPLSSPRSPTSAPAFGVTAADSSDHEEQPLPRLQRSHEEDALQARGCEAPFPLDEGLAVRPEAEQVSVQVAWRRGREDHSEEGGGAGE